MQTNPTIDMNGRQWTRTGRTFLLFSAFCVESKMKQEDGEAWAAAEALRFNSIESPQFIDDFPLKLPLRFPNPPPSPVIPGIPTPPHHDAQALASDSRSSKKSSWGWIDLDQKGGFFFCPKFEWLAVILMPVPGSLSLTHGHSHRFPLVPTKIYSPPRVPRGRMCWQKGRDHHHLISQWWRQWWHVGILAWELD